jgi:HK97 family phage prohead protease
MSKNKDQADYILQIDQDAERRYLAMPVAAEKRADDSGLYEISGYAAKFNSPALLGWYEETIMPGAFDEVMGDDVRCLFNHDPNMVLARSANGTLKLEIDTVGLRYHYVTPDRQLAKDVQDMIMTGDISQSSFAFRVKEASWEYAQQPGEIDKRKIMKIEKLYDVAPVTYPAYGDTTVAKRSADQNRPAPEPRRLTKALKSKISLATI